MKKEERTIHFEEQSSGEARDKQHQDNKLSATRKNLQTQERKENTSKEER